MSINNSRFINSLIEMPLYNEKWGILKKENPEKNPVTCIDFSNDYTSSLQKVASRINQEFQIYVSSKNMEPLSKENCAILEQRIIFLNEKIKKRNASLLRKILHILTFGFGFKKIERISNLIVFLNLPRMQEFAKKREEPLPFIKVKKWNESETPIKKLFDINRTDSTPLLTVLPCKLGEINEYDIHSGKEIYYKDIEEINFQ